MVIATCDQNVRYQAKAKNYTEYKIDIYIEIAAW